MAEIINIQTTDDFQNITGVDITSYFISFAIFCDYSFPKVVDFYAGKTNNPDRDSFVLLDFLNERTQFISQKINVYKESLNNYKYWIVVEKFEEIKQKLDTVTHISKYLRTSILPNSYKSNPTILYTLKQGDTLESVSRNILFDSNSQNDWSKIAIENNLIEEDYTPNGGTVVKVSLANNAAIVVQSVLDNLTTDNIYGKDFSKNIEFVRDIDGDDLKILSPKDTLIQSVTILANLKKGNNPAFPDDGIDKSLVTGSNRNIISIAFPALLRQFQQVFRKDDTIASITITDVDQFEDGISFEYEIKTVLEDILPKFSVKF